MLSISASDVDSDFSLRLEDIEAEEENDEAVGRPPGGYSVIIN